MPQGIVSEKAGRGDVACNWRALGAAPELRWAGAAEAAPWVLCSKPPLSYITFFKMRVFTAGTFFAFRSFLPLVFLVAKVELLSRMFTATQGRFSEIEVAAPSVLHPLQGSGG